MVKIKQKKQLNLPQLIEWLLKSGYRNYTANSNMGNIVTLSRYGAIQFSLGTFFPEETFTVEIEEEITEDTELDLIERFIVNNKTYYTNTQMMSINTCLGAATDDIIPTHFYIENDNRELVLIWRDGRLVE